MIQQHKPGIGHQNILRAVIAVHYSGARVESVGDKVCEKLRRPGMLRCRVTIVGLDTQCFKERSIIEHGLQSSLLLARAAVNGTQQFAKLLHMLHLDSAGQQTLLPILMGTWHRLHGEQVMLRIFEEQRGNRPWWREAAEPDQPERFLVTAPRVAGPIGRDAQFGQGLPSSRLTSTVRLDMPPCKLLNTGISAGSSRPVCRR